MTFSAGKCSVRKNPSTALHENAPNKLLTAYATNPNHYTVIPTTFSKALLPFPTPTLPKPHYSLKIANTLASLVKGRWIDGKAQTVPLLRFTCDISVFFYLPNFSAVKTEGLLSYPTINEIFRTIPLAFRRVRVCVCFICSASLRNFGHTR